MSAPLAPPRPLAVPLAPGPRKSLFLYVGLLGVLILSALALWLWWERRTHPTAFALLRIARHTPRLLDDPARDRQDERDFEAYGRSQAALVKTRLVLNSALRQPEVAALPAVREPTDPLTW